MFVHTINDQVISISDYIRLPKSYHRFQGLIEKLFKENKIEADNTTLLELHDMTFEELLAKIKPSKTFGFSTTGSKSTFQDVAQTITDDSCIVVGGFQKGHFNNETQKLVEKSFSINNLSLEAHLVASRLVYEYEKTIFI